MPVTCLNWSNTSEIGRLSKLNDHNFTSASAACNKVLPNIVKQKKAIQSMERNPVFSLFIVVPLEYKVCSDLFMEISSALAFCGYRLPWFVLNCALVFLCATMQRIPAHKTVPLIKNGRKPGRSIVLVWSTKHDAS